LYCSLLPSTSCTVPRCGCVNLSTDSWPMSPGFAS
jgi:hypothetical protein